MTAESTAADGTSPLRRALLACRRHFAAAAAFSALINLLYLTPTLYMLLVYDRVMPTGGLDTLWLVSVVGLTALATLSLLEWVRSRLLVRASAQLERELAGPVLSAVLSQRGLSRVARGQAMRQFDIFRQAMAGHAILTAFDAPWAPIYLLAAFVLHPAVGALCVVSAAIMLGLAWLNERATHAPLKSANDAAALAYAKQDHVSDWAAEVRALGMGPALVAKQLGERHGATDLQITASFSAARYNGLIKFTRLVLQSAALGLGAYLAIERQISSGAVIAATLLLTRALSPIELIVGGWKSIIQAHGAYESLQRLFANQRSHDAYMHLPSPKGDIALENVSALSPSRDRVALADVSFKIEAGQFVGVVGSSGAGKSTLLRLLAGAALADKGVVRIDGSAFDDWDPERLALYIGFLPQDFLLFPGTISENISRFRVHLGIDPEIVDAETIEAAKSAGAHEMILRLPQGYATRVGLGGTGLSAGQTQRIALARALFGRPSMVILDEPNAHLDGEGEHQLIACLERLRDDGVTVIVAAHRGSVLAAADRLLLLNNGRVELFGRLADVATHSRAQAAALRAGGEAAPVAGPPTAAPPTLTAVGADVKRG
jgi:ATP-binding cassette subfamily C protein